LAARDIDLKVFCQQLARLDPSHIFVRAASNDRALRIMPHCRHISRRETGGPQSQMQDARLGNFSARFDAFMRTSIVPRGGSKI
jgi:hypothetical protein